MTQVGDKHYSASVLFISQDTPRKVLLVHHQKLDRWIQSGGYQEPGENYYEAAVREAKEETDKSHGLAWFTLEEVEQIQTFEELRITLRREMVK